MPDKDGIFADMVSGCQCHFLDSGSFTLWTLAEKWAKENSVSDPYKYYETPEFLAYMDAYAAFIKKHKSAIDYYANVDAIPNPEVTFRNQKYLEKNHGLSPVPVVHYKTDLSWLEKYISRSGLAESGSDDGKRDTDVPKHPLIALGGLVGSTNQERCKDWLDRAFAVICDQPSGLPRARIHGFGVTSFPLLLRYPWWSTDSTTWTMVGAMGGILVPHMRHGKWVFKDPFPYVVKFSDKSKEIKLAGKHFYTMAKGEQRRVLQWLEEIDVPLGAKDKEGEVTEYGVTNRHCERKAANLLFFERMRKTLPEYPWAFQGVRRRSLGITIPSHQKADGTPS